jgi:ligand-binding sensor domain-containing protein
MLFAVAAAAPVHADALSLGTPAQIQRRWTVEDGLPSNAVSAVVNDADGFSWVATLAGLARFDGVRFELHDAAAHPELGSDRFTTMKRTPDGALWLSTEQYELFRFQDQQFSRIEGVSVLSATQAANGWLAYGTTRGVLLVTAGGIRETRPDLIDEAVIELDWPEPDTLLALTDTQLLELEHPGADARIRRRLSFPGRNSGALLRRADGRVLIGRDDGLHQIDRDWHQPPEHLWSDAAVIALSSLDREQILLATATGMAELRGDVPAFFAENRDSRGDEPMLLRAGDTSWRVLADRMVGEGAPDMVASGRISDALIDAERSVWIATHAAGLVQYRSADARLLGRPEGLHGDNVYPLLSTRDGALWVSTLDGGLQRWSGGDAGTWVQPALPFEVVWSLHEARDGGLWVVGDGVCLLRDHACSQAGMPEAMQNQPPVRLVFEDPAGRVWVGTQWALWRREGDQWHTLSATEGTQPGRAARAMVAAPNDHLWLATNGDGLFEFVGGRRARQITTAQGLSSNALRALWRDPDNGELWVGTENRGLCRLRADLQPVAVRCVGTAQGLPSNGIHAIAADAFARFWMNSNQGVFHVDRAELQSLLDGHGERMTRIGVFNAANGLRSSEGNGAVFPSVATDVAGRVWFPTQGGIAIFDPAAVRTTHAPAARIDRVHVGSTVISAPTRSTPAPIRASRLHSPRIPTWTPSMSSFATARWRERA